MNRWIWWVFGTAVVVLVAAVVIGSVLVLAHMPD